MTFLQKALADGISMPFKSCPYKYGYEKFDLGVCASMGGCIDCWNRVIPQEQKINTILRVYGDEDAPTAVELRKLSNITVDRDNPHRHMDVCDELNELYTQKNHDYGDSFHESFVQDGLLMAKIRLGDKYKRFCTLISAEQAVKDESIRDTLLDLANYAIMTIMELDRSAEDGKK